MDLNLTGRKALVTGGSAGIGLATAIKLAREGCDVAICARDPQRLGQAASRIREDSGREALICPADVTRPDDIRNVVKNVHSAFGRIDILVNNAGNGIYKPFLEVSDDELLSGMQINFFATFRMCREVIPLMMEAGGGSIVNITGISGSCAMAPPFYSTCTGPAKAAENRLTKALAMEFGPSNIRVNAVSPGRINAPERLERWLEKIDAGRSGSMSVREIQQHWGRQISLPDHRWGEIEEIANLALFASSDACGFMTGAILVADGGETHD